MLFKIKTNADFDNLKTVFLFFFKRKEQIFSLSLPKTEKIAVITQISSVCPDCPKK